MTMPSDPFMLLSMVNMKLRDGDWSSPQELADSLSWDFSDMDSRLRDAGFTYMADSNQYR